LIRPARRDNDSLREDRPPHLAVLSGSGVITADNEVGSTEVLADDGVPDGFAGTGHAHREGKESERGHAVGIGADDGLVDSDLVG
jgi:hypothetical protein